MSGRLTILPKKSYCPWNQENVERVLRDERLERERLERESKAAKYAGNDRRRQRRGDGDGDPSAATTFDGGHINLFPEAKQAELKLATSGNAKGGLNDDKDAIPPMPLGGDEAGKKKVGAVPFYMKTKSSSGASSDGAKYENTSGSFRLGDNRGRGRGGAAAMVTVDEITGAIMRDQFVRREDGRKERMDPMIRFASSCRASSGTAPSEGSRRNSSGPLIANDFKRDEDGKRIRGGIIADHDKSRDEKRRKKHRRKRSRRAHGDENDSVDSDDSASSSSTSSSDALSNGSDSGHGKRRYSRDGRKHKSHRRRSHSEDRHHGRKRSKSRGEHRNRSKKRRHRDQDMAGSADERTKHRGGSESQAENDRELEDLRKRRRAREVREAARERRVLGPTGAAGGAGVRDGSDAGYHDQFHPTLSRN